jgi:hypothetical protein
MEGGGTLRARAVLYGYCFAAATVALAAISLVMLLLSLHHSTRSAASNTGMGFHDGGE